MSEENQSYPNDINEAYARKTIDNILYIRDTVKDSGRNKSPNNEVSGEKSIQLRELALKRIRHFKQLSMDNLQQEIPVEEEPV